MYLLNGTRFKLSFNGRGNVSCFSNYRNELDGQWVVLVDAENDKHLNSSYPTPPAQEDEPVAWASQFNLDQIKTRKGSVIFLGSRKLDSHTIALYTHPDNSELRKAARRALMWILGGLCAIEDDGALPSESDRLGREIANDLRAALDE